MYGQKLTTKVWRVAITRTYTTELEAEDEEDAIRQLRDSIPNLTHWSDYDEETYCELIDEYGEDDEEFEYDD